MPKQSDRRDGTQAGGWPPERRFLHYPLAGGIAIIAPADLPQPEQQRLARLLQAAAQIYERSAVRHASGDNGQSKPTNDKQD